MHWTGAGGDDSWHNRTNGSTLTVPGASDDTVINAALAVSLYLAARRRPGRHDQYPLDLTGDRASSATPLLGNVREGRVFVIGREPVLDATSATNRQLALTL